VGALVSVPRAPPRSAFRRHSRHNYSEASPERRGREENGNMSPISISLQQILDLAPYYSPRSTPDMRKRAEIGNDLAAELGIPCRA
jgi:hypothetical protein